MDPITSRLPPLAGGILAAIISAGSDPHNRYKRELGMATKNQVLDALRIRYDYYASGSVLNELMELNRITGEDGFSERDIKKLAD